MEPGTYVTVGLLVLPPCCNQCYNLRVSEMSQLLHVLDVL